MRGNDAKNYPVALHTQRRQWQPTPVLLPGKSHGAWQAVVHGVAKSEIRLKDLTRMPYRSVRNKSEANKQTPLHYEVS